MLDPLVLVFGGLGLLVASLVIVAINREGAIPPSPYDVPEPKLGLEAAIWSIRHADVQYWDGVAVGERMRAPNLEELARALDRLDLGTFEVKSAKKRHEFTVRNGPFSKAPAVDEPLCYLTRGILAGSCGATLDREVDVVEEACAGTGSPECVFSVEVKEREEPRFTQV
ncbi:MAG TPA: V4R domain-containing protein [Candidatus Thermoplasmatota archaeon]|nr:V4R domain-containing protein [Candidatus Thermoplasmatota archaeon]